MTINNTLTKERFGYTNEELSQFSTFPIVIDCDFCLTPFERKKMQFSKPSRREIPHACKKCDQIKSNWKKQSALSPHEYFSNYETMMGSKDFPNILWDKTKEKFGHTKDDMNPRSEKRILVICEFCLNEYETCLATLNRVGRPSACKPCSSLKSQRREGESPAETHARLRTPVDHTQLNISKTIDTFGFDPRLIPSKSEKKIIINCYVCQSEYETWMASYSDFAPYMSCSKPACRYTKTQKTLFEKYGVRTTLDISSVKAKLTDPKTEQLVCGLLDNTYKVSYERSKTFGPYSFDFFIPSANLLLECQGDFFHNFKDNGYSGTARDQSKATYIANYTNLKLVHLWEHEIHIGRVKKVLDHHLGVARTAPIECKASDVTYKQIDLKTAFEFLSLYHYLGSVTRNSVSIGAYYQDTLVGVCSFGGVTRHETISKTNNQTGLKITKTKAAEIKRFAIRSNVTCKNLGSKFIAEAVKLYKLVKPQVEYFISFADESVGDMGGLYKAANFQSLGKTSKSYHYMDGTKAIHKKTVYNTAVAAKLTESEFAKNAGLVKVEEKPKSKWLIRLK
jgi:hypothetical protein